MCGVGGFLSVEGAWGELEGGRGWKWGDIDHLGGSADMVDRV